MRPKTKINIETISAKKPFERFSQFTKQLMSVPKAEIDKREAEYQKRKSKSHHR